LFCAVNTNATPAPPDPFEPFKTAQAVISWGVDYIVLTSVDRDDLIDGGADHFATTVQLLKQNKPTLLVECLVSDFAGNLTSVAKLACSGLDVYAHNVETVERLQPYVRDRRAGYRQSLATLAHAKQQHHHSAAATSSHQQPPLYTKTSLMLGLGETRDEIIQTLRDLRAIDVDVGTCVLLLLLFSCCLFLSSDGSIVPNLEKSFDRALCYDCNPISPTTNTHAVTFGQYLRPTEQHLAVVEYIRPEVFDEYRRIGEQMGFKYVASGPLVRSSYKAGEYFLTNMIRPKGPTTDSTQQQPGPADPSRRSSPLPPQEQQ
jgi:lipoyl synthase